MLVFGGDMFVKPKRSVDFLFAKQRRGRLDGPQKKKLLTGVGKTSFPRVLGRHEYIDF